VVRAVESVFSQTFTDFELIVVDDGSTDDTRSRLESYGDRLTVIGQDRAGVSAARNRGLDRAAGDLIAFLDSDDWWAPEKLTAQVDFFEARSQAVICQTDETWIRDGRRVNPGRRHAKPDGEAFFRSLDLCLISPSAVMMRRRLFDQYGGFDESLPACEDYDLWLRVTARQPVFLIPRPLVFKTGGHDDQLSRLPGLDRYRVRALQKLIDSGILTVDQRRAAERALARKARVYGQGCQKRGRWQEAAAYLDLARTYQPPGAKER
jgi:glycosyltransferase involved in cell wall biosynthesis